MLRPDESHSALSSWLNAMRSATCSPSRSMTRSSWPARSSKAMPVWGGIVVLFIFSCSDGPQSPWNALVRRLSAVATAKASQSVRERTLARNLWKRRPPILLHGAPRILPRFRLLPKIAQHRINRSLQRQITLPNRFLHPFPISITAQSLELLVRVEDEHRPRKSPRRARTIGVHSNHIKRPAGEAEGKMRIRRIRSDLVVPVEPVRVVLVKEAKLFP